MFTTPRVEWGTMQPALVSIKDKWTAEAHSARRNLTFPRDGEEGTELVTPPPLPERKQKKGARSSILTLPPSGLALNRGGTLSLQ